MDEPYIEYNTKHSELEGTLKSIDRLGDFFAEGRMDSLPPRMRVSSVGRIAYPILPIQLAPLIAVAERAPYGKGPDTLLDRSVRDCWQIGSADVELSGPHWNETLELILERVAKELGLPPDKVRAELYKLLIYEPGGFFADHRDTEKADGMVGTLVIGLPVEGEGGELEVRHAGREVTLDLRVDDLGELPFAAFYADCVHRTEPVRTGHRVSLVFNLLVRPGSKGIPSTGPELSAQIDTVSRMLADWPQGKDSPKKLAWILDHKYSEKGLCFDSLKGLDLPVGRVLAAAAQSADCVLHLAVLRIEESGIPEDVWVSDEDYAKEIDYTGIDCAFYEVTDQTCTLIGWVDPDGRNNSDLSELPLRDGELLPVGAMQGAEPDRQTLFEATGNGGASLSRSYRRAAFVIWPKSKAVQAIASGGIEGAVRFVRRELEVEGRPEEIQPRRELLVRQLLDVWPQGRPFTSSGTFMERTGWGVLKMLELLIKTDKPGFTERFLKHAVPRQYHQDLNSVLTTVLESVSLDTLREFLPEFVRLNAREQLAGVSHLLARLSSADESSSKGDRLEILRESASNAFDCIPAAIGVEQQGDWAYRYQQRALDSFTIRDLFLTSASLGLNDAADSAAALLQRHSNKADPCRAVPHALNEMHDHSQALLDLPAIMKLWRHAAGHLLARSALPPRPNDKSIDAPVRCNCEHCRRLKDFCRNQYETVLRFKQPQHVRMHLEAEIRTSKVDVKCETLKVGLPHTLICTKTQAGFEKRRVRYAEDVDAMRMLVSASPKTAKADLPKVLRNLREAIDRSK